MNEPIDVAVVGGGLSGLAAAHLLSRRGRKVTVFEGSSRVGGNAQSPLLGGLPVNLGPHALYLGGAAAQVLTGLGIRWERHLPPLRGAKAWHHGRLEALPSSAWGLLATGLLDWKDRVGLARVLLPLMRSGDSTARADEPLGAYLDRVCDAPAVRTIVDALFRLSTYAHAQSHLSAAVACRQLHTALAKNVTYLPFAALADALGAGLDVRTARPVRKVHPDGRLGFDGGEEVQARMVVIATPLPAAVKVFDDPRLARFHAEAVPARAACLDLVLRALPCPGQKIALGTDVPLYASVHREGPHGVVLQAAQYLGPGDEGRAARAPIEAMLDAFQPGWRAHVMEERFLPELTVTSALPLARNGGQGFGVKLSECVFAAADWAVGGMLTDGGLEAARQIAIGAEGSVRLSA